MIHYNFDCDFKIAEQLIAEAPFRYTYYAKSEKTVVAEYDGTDYHGCYPMEDMLIVPINAGSLGLGEVKVRREYYLTDKDFTDGICNRVTGNVPLGIEIWRGETDGMETHEVKVVPAYQKGDPFTFDDMTDAQKQDIANRVPTKEPEREKAEAQREQNELLRQANEAERENKEAERQSIFSTNETERQQVFETNEAIRQENETKRVDAEILRQEAETIREATYKNKVDRDDNAPKLTAGFANNLVGRGEATPQEISFRPSGGDTSIEDGTARIDRVKGSTVVWNQLRPEVERTSNSIKIVSTSPLTLESVSAAADSLAYFVQMANVIKDHIYLIRYTYLYEGTKDRVRIHLSGINEASFNFATSNFVSKNTKETRQYILRSAASASSSGLMIGYNDGMEVGERMTIYEYQLIDLTQMFGAGNEPTTIEEFNARKPIGIDEYAYNEGELISANVDEIKSVGFNAWDEEWEQGSFDLDGALTKDLSRIRTKNPFRVIPSAIYNVESGGKTIGLRFYDKDDNHLGRDSNHNTKGGTITIPTNAYYMRFSVVDTKTYNHDICINLSHTGYRNGEYEPYKEFMRNIPIKDIKDSDGNQLFPNGLLSAGSVYDEITATKAIKRIGVVDLGTLSWERRVTNTQGVEWNHFITSLTFNPNRPSAGGVANAISPLYECAASNALKDVELHDKTYMIYHSGDGLFLRDDSYTDTATFKAAMSGVMLYYELAEPIEVDLEEPLNLDYEVSDFGTEEVISDVPTTPMKADIIYQFNAVDRIRDNSRHTAEAEIKLKDYETRIAALEAIVTSLTSGEV